jgi:hypothetical protein
MRYLVNGTLRSDRTREDFVGKIKDQSLSDEAWDLVRRGVVGEHGFKIGQRPGFFLVMEGDSEEAVRGAIEKLPFLRDGWFEIEIDPMSRFLSDIR